MECLMICLPADALVLLQKWWWQSMFGARCALIASDVVVMLHRACLPLAPQYIANLFMELDMEHRGLAPAAALCSIIITCDR